MSHAIAIDIDGPEPNRPQKSASVDVLTAEVKAVVIGKRQVTLSVYRQLDEADISEMEPWGRVRASKDPDERSIELIGRRISDGSLVAASVRDPGFRVLLGESGQWKEWLIFTPPRHDTPVVMHSADGYDAVMWVLGDQRYGSGKPHCTYLRDDAEEIVRSAAERRIKEQQQKRQEIDALRELPLIVLAGFR